VLDYDLATPMMLVHLFPSGMLGLGVTALLASFMSGMAGNVTAFNTVWTYDIYQSHIRRGASDAHYLWMGRIATVGGVVLALGAAYVAGAFNNIMDLLQLVFAFVNAPLFVLEALHRPRRLLGSSRRHAERGGPPRSYPAGRHPGRSQGRIPRGTAHLSQ